MSELMKLARAAANRQAATDTAPTQGVSATAALPSGARATCAHYRTALETSLGRCAMHRTEIWGDIPDGCANDWTPADSAAREFERRRAGVVARLKADPVLRYSFDVANAPLSGPADRDVRVLLGLRTADGGVVTGHITIPAARWPGLAMFNEHWRRAAEARPT